MKKIWNGITTAILVIAVGTACFVAGNYISVYDVMGVFGLDIAPKEAEIASVIEPASELLVNEYPYTNSVRVKDARETFKVEISGADDDLAFTYDGKVKAGYDMKQTSYRVDKVGEKITVLMPELSLECISVDKASVSYAGNGSPTTSESTGESGQSLLPWSFGSKDDDEKDRTEGDSRSADENLLVKRMTSAARSDEAFTKMTRVNAEGIIRALLGADRSTGNYELEFEWA